MKLPDDSAGAAKKPRRPDPVKVGDVTVRIYRLASGAYQGRYYLAGRAQRITRAKLSDLRAEAARLAHSINAGRAQAGELSAAEAQEYVHARALLAPGDPPLSAVVREWRDAREAAGNRATVGEMARFWAARHRVGRAGAVPTSGVLEEMLAAKAKEGALTDPHYLRLLRQGLEKFCRALPGPIGEVREAQILDYLAGLGVAARTRNNARAAIVSLFRFARRRRYLADETTEAERVAAQKVVRRERGVFTPDELRVFLAHVRPELRPWMVIGAFAGVRTEEICGDEEDPAQEQLEWGDLHWREGQIRIRPEVGKTDEGRLVPIPANLLAWLLPWRERRGPVCPRGARVRLETARLTAATGQRWTKNGLRHSFASYHYALHRDMGLLTSIMGNTEAINRGNYQNPRFREQAEAWFAILPDAAGSNVVAGNFGTG